MQLHLFEYSWQTFPVRGRCAPCLPKARFFGSHAAHRMVWQVWTRAWVQRGTRICTASPAIQLNPIMLRRVRGAVRRKGGELRGQGGARRGRRRPAQGANRSGTSTGSWGWFDGLAATYKGGLVLQRPSWVGIADAGQPLRRLPLLPARGRLCTLVLPLSGGRSVQLLYNVQGQ